MRVDLTSAYPQIVILANTKELANQIYSVIIEIGKPMMNLKQKNPLKITLCIGGNPNLNKNLNSSTNYVSLNLEAASQSHILIFCTPGRLNSLLNMSPYFLLKKLKMLILDEADQLLSEDFLEQIQFINKKVNKDAQTCLFSATTNSKTLQSIKMHLMKSPVELYIKKEKIQINDIKNLYFDAETEENKYNVLIELYQNITICQTVIFVNTITKACSLGNKLIHEKFSVGIIHGKLSDYERTETLKKFRKTQTRVFSSN